MSMEIRPAVTSDIEPVCHLLHTHMNAKFSLERWRKILNYDWLPEKPDLGRVVETNGIIMGYCGLIYADRVLGRAGQTRTERIAGMSSWYLDKSLRGKGIGKALLVDAVSDRSTTYVGVTHSRKRVELCKSVGFRLLEAHRYEWRKNSSSHPAFNIERNVELIRRQVEPVQRKIIDDMEQYPVDPVLIEQAGRQALIYFSIKRKDSDDLWFDLMYSSNHEIFSECAQSIANSLLPDSPALMAADSRFVPQPQRGLTKVPLPVGRYFITDSVAPDEVDHLYCELQLLDLKLE